MSQLSGEIEAVRARASGAGIPLIGDSVPFVELLRSVERIARHGNPAVLIRGETGTGKELIARAIHYLGDRRDFPFVPVNCGALPDQLAENELFGHRAGAYTGAGQESVGLLRLAHRGTLFLDEVDSLPARTQVALLRFLQDGCFRPLGTAREERVDVRIIAASNRCLEEEIRAGRLRPDLFFRLNLIGVEVPPLRQRAGDVSILSQHFLRECVRRYRLPDKCIHDGALSRLAEYAWPGNVRELENLIHRAVLLSDGAEIRIESPAATPTSSRVAAQMAMPGDAAGDLSYHDAKSRALREFDHAYLTQLIRRAHGNVTKAAQLAGKERRAMGKLLKKYGIDVAGLRATD